MVNFTVNIGEQETAWKGWRWECEAIQADRVPQPGRPFVKAAWSESECLVVTRVCTRYRDLEPYFETTWLDETTVAFRVALIGELAGLSDVEWVRLGHGRKIAEDPKNLTGRIGHRRRLVETPDRWRAMAESAEEIRRGSPRLRWSHIAARLGIPHGTLKRWRGLLANLQKLEENGPL